MNAREDFTNQLTDKILEIRDWSAPYGIITALTASASRTPPRITFGLARTLDASVDVYSETYLVLRTSHGDTILFKSEKDFLDHLTKTYA